MFFQKKMVFCYQMFFDIEKKIKSSSVIKYAKKTTEQKWNHMLYPLHISQYMKYLSIN